MVGYTLLNTSYKYLISSIRVTDSLDYINYQVFFVFILKDLIWCDTSWQSLSIVVVAAKYLDGMHQRTQIVHKTCLKANDHWNIIRLKFDKKISNVNNCNLRQILLLRPRNNVWLMCETGLIKMTRSKCQTQFCPLKFVFSSF